MAKTVQPGTITIPGIGEFAANALPDPFDSRDLEYRPRLQPLPAVLDQRQGSKERYVMHQDGNSCTGHALAAVINAVLARSEVVVNGNAAAAYPHVSPYMLYRLARRYDEFEGESDVGSSLRGAFKGWFNHGALLEADWPALNQYPEPDLDDENVIEKARVRPLGAFYRVGPYRLDDMQSAISELNAICVLLNAGLRNNRLLEVWANATAPIRTKVIRKSLFMMAPFQDEPKGCHLNPELLPCEDRSRQSLESAVSLTSAARCPCLRSAGILPAVAGTSRPRKLPISQRPCGPDRSSFSIVNFQIVNSQLYLSPSHAFCHPLMRY